MEMFNKIVGIAMSEHEGSVAFEYLIILIIMAVALFIGLEMLGFELDYKALEISEFIRFNGQGSTAE